MGILPLADIGSAPYISRGVIMTGKTGQDEEPLEYPIDGTLDLHQFSPDQTRAVVTEYIAACLERGLFSLRIIHGKGIGVQREIVRSLLEKHPDVISIRHEEGAGGWGATVIDLRRSS